MGKIIPEQRECCFTSYLTAYNFIPHLQIPIEFLKKQSKHMRVNVKIVTDDGKLRILKIEKIEKDYFFTTGWKDFAEEMDLRNGELLLFKLVKESKFHFSVYGTDGCCKRLCSSDDEQGSESESENEDDEMDGSGNSINWTLKLTRDHEAQLELSKDLANKARISALEKLDVIENGKKVGRIHVMQKRDKFYLTAGWNEFLVRNGIVMGSTVSLDFVRGGSRKIIKFKLLKSRSWGELFRAKKTVGRPPNMIRKT